MVKRVAQLSVLAAVVATSLVAVVPPARATHCGDVTYADPKDPNRPTPAGYGFIVRDGLDVRVDPEGAGPYAVGTALYYAGLVGWAGCETGAGAVVSCALAAVDKAEEIAGSIQPQSLDFRYLYQDPEGGWEIGGNQLVADVGAITGCLTP